MRLTSKRIVAAIACISCGEALAQTSVTLYGVADGGIRVDHTNVGTLKGMSSGGGAGSRWGLRGTEDLGGDYKATFVFEQGIDIGDNSVPQGNITGVTPTSPTSSTGSRLFGRIATVGLSGPFGSLRFGRDYKPIFLLYATVDPFGAGYVATAGNIAPRLVSRYDNAIWYDTPTLYGFKIAAAYALGESTTNTTPGTPKDAGNRGGASISYSAGKLYASYAYSHERAGTTSPLLSNGINRTRINDAGITYDFDVVKLHAFVWTVKDDLGFKVRDGFVGATIPFGAWTFLAGYGHINDMGSSNPATPSAKTNYDANFYGGTATYSLSKRTTLYGSAARFSIRNGGTYAIIDANSPQVGLFTAANIVGVNPWSAQLGVTHRF